MLKLTWMPGAAVIPDDPNRDHIRDSLIINTPSGATDTANFPRVCDGSTAPLGQVQEALAAWLGSRSRDQRVVLMVHGFQYDPLHAGGHDDPFTLVYGVPTTASTPPTSQPQAGHPDPSLSWLPIVGETTAAGAPGSHPDQCIAFSWLSEGTFWQSGNSGWPSLPETLSYPYPAFDLAPLAARALAIVIAALQNLGQQFDILAHSLGTRATSQAIGLLRHPAFHLNWKPTLLRRAVLLDGAEYKVDANQNLIGADFEVVNFVNKNDWVVTYLAQKFSTPARPVGADSAQVIGACGLRNDDHWLDIQLANFPGIQLGGSQLTLTSIASDRDELVHSHASLNHWVCYMADDNRAFITDLLWNTAPPFQSVAVLKAAGFPAFAYSPVSFDWTVPETPQTVAERADKWWPPKPSYA